MAAHNIQEGLKKWLCDEVVVVKGHQSLGQLLSQLPTRPHLFILVECEAGEPLALLSSKDLLRCLGRLKRSRLPVDMNPREMTVRQMVYANPASDYYLMDLSSMKQDGARWLRDLPCHRILIRQGRELVGVVGEENFHEFLKAVHPPGDINSALSQN